MRFHGANAIECRTILVAAMLFVAMGATAQKSTVRVVLLDELCDDRVKEVFLVYHETDDRLPMTPDGKCRWKSEDVDTFSEDITTFSLRIGGLGGRTPCRRVTRKSDGSYSATFSRRGKGDAHTLEISGPPADYAREVNDQQGYVPCWEVDSIQDALLDVQLDMENIRLQPHPARHPACGAIVDDLLSPLTTGADIRIDSKQLAKALTTTSWKGKLCYSPNYLDQVILQKTLPNNPTFDVKVVK